MYNDLLTIGGFTIHGYGLMIGIGIIAAWQLTEKRAVARGLSPDAVFTITIWAALGGLLGANVLYLITMAGEIMRDPAMLFRELATGFVVYGGIIGGIFSGWLCCRVHGFPFLQYFDLVMPSIALAQGFGRIGCLLAGCCYGMPWEGACALTFTHSDFAPNGVKLFPTQPVYSLLDFLHCGILCALSDKMKVPGRTAALYLILYSAGRFVMEFFRGDEIRGSVGALSTSQFIALFIFLAGILLFVYAPRAGKARTPEEG